MKIKANIWIILLLAINISAFAALQDNNIYNDMSLEEMSQIDVAISASKRSEDLFETPLSVTIIKKEEIIRSGATSIPEALRLAPGVIVREITPGNFDVHIRGFDDVTRSYILPLPMNTITLVMIDNRQSYSYYTGGTFWETLPVSINDIERIEVVSGPASALYGPNAVAGVINIITTHAKEEGMNASFTITRGTNNAGIINANLGYNYEERIKASISFNANTYDRTNEDYFSWDKQSYISADSMRHANHGMDDGSGIGGVSILDDPKKSLRSFGINGFLTYNYNDDLKIDTKFGTQGSQAQKVYINNFETPLTYCESQSSYYDIKLDFYGFKFQSFGESGDYNTNYFYSSHSYKNEYLSLDYMLDIGGFIIRPGIGLTSSEYSSPVLQGARLGLSKDSLGDKEYKKIANYNGSLFVEWMPLSQLRFVAGLRNDYYEFNKKSALSYELAGTYRFDKNNMLRGVYSLAYRSPFMLDSYFDAVSFGRVPSYSKDTFKLIPSYTYIKGNEDLDLIKQSSIEIGFRHKFSDMLSFDWTAFYSNISNNIIMTGSSELYINEQTQQEDSLVSSAYFVNTDDIDAYQLGTSISFKYKPNGPISYYVYGMYQYTNLDIKNPNISDIALIRFENKSTPEFTLGCSIDYSPFDRFNINASYYFMSSMTYSGLYGEEVRNGSEINQIFYDNEISSVNNLNLSISANVWDNISIVVTGKNLIGKQTQYGFADEIDRTFLISLQIK